MRDYKREFIEFMVASGVLTFGDFTTKSGRQTPYFINTGNYDTGEQMARLGGFYARAIVDTVGGEFDNLYGPAYKGIPLCVSAAIALARDFQRNVTFSFNRKEAKDHGEGGSLIGHRYRGDERVVIIEDVTTAGTSVRESIEILAHAASRPICPRALVVSVDRMERGTGEESALAELARELDIQTFAIVTIDEIVEHLRGREIEGQVLIDDAMLEKIRSYRERYGAKA